MSCATAVADSIADRKMLASVVLILPLSQILDGA
jgi:hypothetical protein